MIETQEIVLNGYTLKDLLEYGRNTILKEKTYETRGEKSNNESIDIIKIR